LAGLQGVHYADLQTGSSWNTSIGYRAVLFIVAPAFLLFSRPILEPRGDHAPTWRTGAHAVPVVLSPWLPAAAALPLAFAIGAGYLAWLARRLYTLRQERGNFRRELLLLGIVFGVALAAAVLGLLAPALPDRLFLSLYASAIGLAFVLVQLTIALRPQLSTEVRETAQAAYATTTLARVDCDGALARLEALMRSDQIHVDPDLSLSAVAERLGLGSHQLSELVNTRLGKGFSRYLREHRVAAAKAMLLAEPKASVLSVGLSCGFTSQSNFYEAFREIEGTTPGQYRKLNRQLMSPQEG